jgi:hypothetical protein
MFKTVRAASASLLLLLACGEDPATTVDAATVIDAAAADAAGPISFHCGFADCPRISIEGDPIATSTFKGYGDPSLERDPGGDLWLAYSWLDELAFQGEPGFAVRTHLARSTDDGATFELVRTTNIAVTVDKPVAGLVLHEVPSLMKDSDNQWRLTWMTYAFLANGERVEFQFVRTQGAQPADLGNSTSVWLAGSATTTPSEYDESLANLNNCLAFTEPALFSHQGVDYLAANCFVNVADPSTERLVLLRVDGSVLSYVGDLLSGADAAALGGTRVEQIDLSVAQDGAVIAIVTPIDDNASVIHRGCVVLEVENLATATMRRDANNQLVRRAVLTADGNGIGPGLCTYDATSSTGIMMVLTDFSNTNIEFSMHATGVHP